MASPEYSLPASTSFEESGGQESETELLDELQLQEILLASLRDSPEENTIERRSAIQAEIKSLQKKLKKLRAAKRGTAPAPASAAFSSMNSNVSRAYSNGNTQPDMFDSGDDVWSQAYPRRDDGSRKRTYSNHLGTGQPTLPESKSRRTTPSPQDINLDSPFDDGNNYSDGSSVVDLTGVHDEDVADMRRRYENREYAFRMAKEREEEDARFARQLQQQYGGDPQSVNHTPSRSEPNAFNRMVDRSSQFSQQGQSYNQSRAGPSGQAESRYLNSPNPSLSTIPGIPSHVKSGASHSTDKFGRQSPMNGPSLSNVSSRARMPGSFDSDFEDSDLEVLDGPPAGFSIQPHRTFSPRFSPASSLYGNNAGNNLVQAGALARQAALQRQDHLRSTLSLGFDSNATGSNLASSGSLQPSEFSSYTPFGAQQWDASRPGMLFDGSTILLQNGSTSNPYGTPGSGGSLLDIANRTNHYDYQNGTDGFGNPIPHLPQQIRDYVEDYMGNPQKTAEEIRNLLSTISPDMEVPPEGQEGTPDGLKVFLYRHQKMALKWMENMEADNQKKGGILADDMGLGKTVSTIALMLSRRVEWDRFNSSNRPVKTNVIVGPVALIKQWEREIDKKVNYRHRFEVHNYHSKKVDYNTLRQKDIVLTTYGTLGAELKKFEEYVKKSTQRGESIDESHLQKLCPFLSPKSQFHRVVLDEAQCIKNKKTQAAKAAGRIVAEYRWCLSGTPMMNSVSELASLINFLRIKPYCETDKFSRTFGCLSATRSGGHNRDKAMRQLQTLLKAIMMRRSKTSIIDGKPIIDLKPKIETVDHVVFNEDDGQFYRDLETESRVTISKYLREGTVGKHYSIALVLLLRLRQACCHPYLHLTDLDYGNNEIPEDVMLELAKTLAPAVVNRIKEAEGFECPICYDAVDNPSIMLPCGHDTCAECLDRLTGNAEQRNLQNGNEGGSKVHCPECRGDIDIKKVITYEYFKKVHMPQPDEATTTAAEKEETASESEDNNETDSEDETDDDMGDDDVDERGNLKDFVVNDDNDGVNADDVDPDTTDLNDELGTVIEKSKATKKSKRPKKNKGKAKQKELEVKPHMLKDLRKDAGKSQEAYRRYMRYLKKIWLPSAKVTKCQELIADIQQTGEKTIVFSQWTLLLDLLEIPIKHELKLGYRRYDGGMSATQRDHAVRDFMENDDVKVILVSLKAGNAGLNLTSASQVIIMDPFWNPYIEMQAIDRAHRIGQQNTVKVHRVLIENTVEDRIVLLQEKKRKLVDAALDEGAAKNIGRLNADDLAYLFGIGGGR